MLREPLVNCDRAVFGVSDFAFHKSPTTEGRHHDIDDGRNVKSSAMDWVQGSRDRFRRYVSLASDLLGPSAVIWCDGKKKAETAADCSGHVHGEGWRSGGPQIDIGQGGLREGGGVARWSIMYRAVLFLL